ncbi:MAG: GIY-YIG nuclease family protein [Kiritimatiellae bacterium]|nr:GIY-YIG nuclease family protein [Kiritimatiellia bacterium]
MKGYTYVYILQSLSEPRCHYTGLTDDLRARLTLHNRGACAHTAKHRPWIIRTATAIPVDFSPPAG